MPKQQTAVSIRLDKEDHRRYKMYLAEFETTFKAILVEEMEKRIKEAEKKKKEK